MSPSETLAQAHGCGNASVQALRLAFNKETTGFEKMGLYTAKAGFYPASTTATVLTLQQGPQKSSWIQSAEVGDSQWCLCRYDTTSLKWVVVYLSREHYYINKEKKTPMQLGKFHNVDTFFNAKIRVDAYSKSLCICLGPAPEFVACGTDGAWSFMHGSVGITQEQQVGVFVNTQYAKWQEQDVPSASFVAFLGNAWQRAVMNFTSRYHHLDDDASLFIADFSKDDLANFSDPPVYFVTDEASAQDMVVNGRIVQETCHTVLSQPNAVRFPAQAMPPATPPATPQATPQVTPPATPQATPGCSVSPGNGLYMFASEIGLGVLDTVHNSWAHPVSTTIPGASLCEGLHAAQSPQRTADLSSPKPRFYAYAHVCVLVWPKTSHENSHAASCVYSRYNREHGDESLGSPGLYRPEKTGLSSRYQPDRADDLNSPKPRFYTSAHVCKLVWPTTSYEST